MAFGPSPVLEVEEAGGAEDKIVDAAQGGESERGSGFSPRECGIDVTPGFGVALRNGTPLVELGIEGGGSGEAFDVAMVERFEASVGRRERDRRGAWFHYAGAGFVGATEWGGRVEV